MPKLGRRHELAPLEVEFGGLQSVEMVNRNAPFGTSFTPIARMKIIGGKPRYVLERKLLPLPEQPSVTREVVGKDVPNVDVKIETGSFLHSQDHLERLRKPLTVVPSIASPKAANLTTRTVVTDNKTTDISRVDQFVHCGKSASDHLSITKPIDTAGKDSAAVSAEDRRLAQQQESHLLEELSSQLRTVNGDVVKHLYHIISSNFDINLTGWVKYSELLNAMNKLDVRINPDQLSVITSKFMLSDRPGSINYEQFLTFLAMALKRRGEQQPVTQLRYYKADIQDRKDQTQWSTVTKDGPNKSLGQLRSMVSRDLLARAPVDIESLRSSFAQADRHHRLTLSRNEVEDICLRMKVALQPSVIQEALKHCRDSGGGQYRWSDFIDILEKVLPSQTGLFIPDSKKPLEYVKHFPKPTSSWPHPEPTSQNRKQPVNPISDPEPSHNLDKQRDSDQVNSKRNGSIQAHLDEKVRTHSRVKTDSGWFERLTKLAQALHRNDLYHHGLLHPDECRWLVTEYSDIYDLGLSKETLEDSLRQNTTAEGTNIDGLLKSFILML